MEIPETRYARSGELNIAYQVVGEAPIELVYIPGFVSNVELAWEDPSFAAFLRGLAAFARVIVFDKRGTGLSDRVPVHDLPTLEERMDDLRAVMDAAGSERAALFGHSEGGAMAILFAATYPERTAALITYGAFPKRQRSADYPWAPTAEDRARDAVVVEREWGRPAARDVEYYAPSKRDDPLFAQWLTTYLRRSASPGAAAAIFRMNTEIDVRHVLPAIRVPTLVIHAVGDRDVQVEEGRFLASQVPGAKYVELPSGDHLFWASHHDEILAEIQEFLTGVRPAAEIDRFLATILFTDIVEGTRKAAELGDRRWRELLERHHAIVREQLRRFRGREVDTAGDGFFATFDGPARAIRSATAARDQVRALGIEIRAGLHTGECEVIAEKVGGLAVIVGARVKDKAAGSDVLVSSTVKDLVAGSGIEFEDRGSHALKGVPGEWRLYRVASA